MPLFKNKYKTESNRLKNWDYSSEAIYFITLVAQNRECVFGTIDNDKMVLNDNGKIIERELLKSIVIRERWIFHNWVIMPNHIHLLIEIVSSSVETHNVETHNVETHCSASLQSKSEPAKLSRKSNSISSFVAIFKSVTTKQINVLIDNNGAQCKDAQCTDAQCRDAQCRDAQCRDALQCVSTKETERSIINTIWQSNYHDHIVRNYNSFDTIYQYIKNNPKNWNTDSINSNLE